MNGKSHEEDEAAPNPNDSMRQKTPAEAAEMPHPAANITYSANSDTNNLEAAQQFWRERHPESGSNSVVSFDVLNHVASFFVANEVRAEIEADDERKAMQKRLLEEKRAEKEHRAKDSTVSLTESGVKSSASVRVGGKEKKFVRVQVHPSLKTGQDYVACWVLDNMTYEEFSRMVCDAVNKSAPTKYAAEEILLRYVVDGSEKLLGPSTMTPSAVLKKFESVADFQFTVKGPGDSDALFAEFLLCATIEVAATRFTQLRRICGLEQEKNYGGAHLFFEKLQEKLHGWRGKRLFDPLTELQQSPMLVSKPLKNLRVLIVGAGLAGLRTAIEAAMAGASVTMLEEEVSGNYGFNVVELWDCTVEDLKRLAFNVFDPSFAVGHRRARLQDLHLVLFKIALCLGVDINIGVRYLGMKQPESRNDRWLALSEPQLPNLTQSGFHAVVYADGGMGGSYDFSPRKRIGIDPGSDASATLLTLTVSCSREKPGQGREALSLSAINNSTLFQSLQETKGIQIHSLSWMGGPRHQMMMTVSKKVLCDRKIIKDGSSLAADVYLADENIDVDAILRLSKEVMQHFANEIDIISPPTFVEKGFTFDLKDCNQISCVSRSAKVVTVCERACYFTYVGEALQQSFWIAGTGPNRAYLSAMDCTWSLIQYIHALKEIDVAKRQAGFDAICEYRENLYYCWAQSNPNNLVKYSKHGETYATCEPSSRYREIFPHFKN